MGAISGHGLFGFLKLCRIRTSARPNRYRKATVLRLIGMRYIHIDDNEQSVLRLICDEVFGYSNFIGTIVQNKLNSKNDSADIQKNHEYIHVYRKTVSYDKNGQPTRLLGRTESKERQVIKSDAGFYYLNDFITTRGEGGILANRLNLGQTVYYNQKTGDFFPEHDYDQARALVSDDESYVYSTIQAHLDNGYVPIRPPKVRGKLGAWTWEKDKMIRDKQLLEVVPVRGRAYSLKSRTFVPSDDVYEQGSKYYYSGVFESNVKSVIEFSTNDGTTALTDVMGVAGTFENPKNPDMLIYLFSLLRKKNPVILDFFAGSGTTGQAVLERNKQDKGSRQFILCTNNQNNICREITYERIHRAIDKVGYQACLKYYRIEFVPITGKFFGEIVDDLNYHIRELVELENGINFKGNAELAIVLTDDEMDEFFENAAAFEKCVRLYKGHDVLLSGEQEEILKARGVEIITIPDYYYKELEG